MGLGLFCYFCFVDGGQFVLFACLGYVVGKVSNVWFTVRLLGLRCFGF